MILGFKTRYPKWMTKKGWHTFFDEKIEAGIKIHSIREDKHDRWKVGRVIHFSTGVRTKNYKQFKVDICKSVQSIWIANHHTIPNKKIILVNGIAFNDEQIFQLAKNDGFDSIGDFFEWFGFEFIGKPIPFGCDFKGKIIHWTDFKY
jgi:hypothetical protein